MIYIINMLFIVKIPKILKDYANIVTNKKKIYFSLIENIFNHISFLRNSERILCITNKA